MKVKCLSLWQPWATLVAIGAKQYETRSWSTSYRGPLVIHAAKTDKSLYMSSWPHFRLHLKDRNITRLEQFPLGAALCLVELVDVVRTETVVDGLSAAERAFGDFSPGRFAWEIACVRRFPEPIPMRGAQGLFEVEIPDIAVSAQ